MEIRKATPADLRELAELAVLMWDTHTTEELVNEFEQIITSDDAVFFLLEDGHNPAGFAQCQLRHDYVEGTNSSPVGYLEGIFVKNAYRNQGAARKLVEECEKWAALQGCQEFASDCSLDNETSRKFHLSVGFEEAGRIICFTRRL